MPILNDLVFGSVISHPQASEEGGRSCISGQGRFLFTDLAQVYLHWPTVTDAQLPIYDNTGNTTVHVLYRTAHKPFIEVFYLL